MFSHRNGGYLNTKLGSSSKSVFDYHSPISVQAKFDIQKGDEIYTSYSLCEDCANRRSGYGTPEIVRDYGFVENYPQQYILRFQEGQVLDFVIDNTESWKKSNPGQEIQMDADENKEYHITWLSPQLEEDDDEEEDDDDRILSDEAMEFLEEQLERLTALQNRLEQDSSVKETMPDSEYSVIVQFLDAFTVALDEAVKSQLCGDDGVCSIGDKYNALQEFEDSLPYQEYSCNHHESMAFHGYVYDEPIETLYQTLHWYEHKHHGDTCFDLDK